MWDLATPLYLFCHSLLTSLGQILIQKNIYYANIQKQHKAVLTTFSESSIIAQLSELSSVPCLKGLFLAYKTAFTKKVFLNLIVDIRQPKLSQLIAGLRQFRNKPFELSLELMEKVSLIIIHSLLRKFQKYFSLSI